MRHPLATRLIELKPNVAVLGRAPEPEPVEGPEAPEAPAAQPEAPRGPTLEEQLAAAHARGEGEGEARAAAAHEAAREADRARAAEALAAERARWAQAEGERLAVLIVEAVGAVESRIAAAAARALRPFLDEAVRERALAGLADTLAVLTRVKPAVAIAMTGPADLGEALMARLDPALAGTIRFTPGPGMELALTVDDTVVETQLALWSRALRGDEA